MVEVFRALDKKKHENRKQGKKKKENWEPSIDEENQSQKNNSKETGMLKLYQIPANSDPVANKITFHKETVHRTCFHRNVGISQMKKSMQLKFKIQLNEPLESTNIITSSLKYQNLGAGEIA